MKHTALLFSSLAMCCSTSFAASDSSFADGVLHMPHVHYQGKAYDVKLKFSPPNFLKLVSATPIEMANMPSSPMVKVEDDFSFKLKEIKSGKDKFKTDVTFDGTNFVVGKVSSAGDPNVGKMILGEKITNLGITADKRDSFAYGISDNGESITGYTRNDKKVRQPTRFHFEHKHIQAFDAFGQGRNYGRAANNSDDIAGFAQIDAGEGSSLRLYNAFYSLAGAGSITKIGPLGEGKDSRAYGMNNTGTVVGWSASLADNTDHIAFSFDTKSKELKALGGDLLGGKRSFAFDVNDKNQIVGVATNAEGSALAFLLEDGKAKSLGSIDDSGYSEARAINSEGQITGFSLNKDGLYVPFISDGTKMTELPNLGVLLLVQQEMLIIRDMLLL